MKNHRYSAAMLVGLLVLGFLPTLAAAEGDVTMSGESGLFTLGSGYTVGKGIFSFSTYLNHWDRRVTSDLTADPLWTDWDLDHERWSAAIGYGVTDRLELSLMLPYDRYDAIGQNADDPTHYKIGFLNGRRFERNIDVDGLANLRLGAKWQLAANQTYGLALAAFVDLDTGEEAEAVVPGDIGYGLGLNWSYGDWGFHAGYFDPGESDFGPVSEEIELGIGYGRTLSEQLMWITELQGALKTDGDGNHDDADVTSGIRVRWSEDSPWAFNAALRVDLSDIGNFNGDYSPWGGLLGLTYSPASGLGRGRPELTVVKRGSGRGMVNSDPMGIDCGETCNASFKRKRLVTLTATPMEGSTFEGWSGDCLGDAYRTEVKMDGDKTCYAAFELVPPPPPPPPPRYTLQVVKKGSGTGTVTSRPAGIDCGASCQSIYDPGTRLRLSAVPDAGSMVAGWSRNCAGGEVTMDRDEVCTVTFDEVPKPITCPDPGPKAKRKRWPCGGSRELVYFESGSAILAEVQQSKLCDLVGQLEYCSRLSSCIAGRTAAGEDQGLAEARAQSVVSFLAHQGVGSDRIKVAPICTAPSGEAGSWVDIYLEK